MAKTIKCSEQELNALRVRALIEGKDLDELMTEMSQNDDEDDDFEIEFEDEKPKKQAKTRKSKEKKEIKTSFEFKVAMKEEYEILTNGTEVNITFNEHDIPYKEQLWPVPSRSVVYNIELIKNPKLSRETAMMFSGNNEEEIKKANDGDTRYMRIVTYESIVNGLQVIGYVKIYCDKSGKLKSKVKVNKELLTKNYVNCEKATKHIETAVGQLISA